MSRDCLSYIGTRIAHVRDCDSVPVSELPSCSAPHCEWRNPYATWVPQKCLLKLPVEDLRLRVNLCYRGGSCLSLSVSEGANNHGVTTSDHFLGGGGLTLSQRASTVRQNCYSTGSIYFQEKRNLCLTSPTEIKKQKEVIGNMGEDLSRRDLLNKMK